MELKESVWILYRSLAFLFHLEPPRLLYGEGIVQSPTGPVTIGNTACINASVTNINVQISCRIENVEESRESTLRWYHNNNLLSVTSEPLVATAIGTYTCVAENDCGNATNSTDVIC